MNANNNATQLRQVGVAYKPFFTESNPLNDYTPIATTRLRDTVIPFGRFKGQTFDEVAKTFEGPTPDGLNYLDWLAGDPVLTDGRGNVTGEIKIYGEFARRLRKYLSHPQVQTWLTLYRVGDDRELDSSAFTVLSTLDQGDGNATSRHRRGERFIGGASDFLSIEVDPLPGDKTVAVEQLDWTPETLTPFRAWQLAMQLLEQIKAVGEPGEDRPGLDAIADRIRRTKLEKCLAEPTGRGDLRSSQERQAAATRMMDEIRTTWLAKRKELSIQRPDESRAEELVAAVTMPVVRRLLRKLGRKMLRPVYLRFYRKMSWEDIAAILGTTVKLAKTRATKALRAIRNWIREMRYHRRAKQAARVHARLQRDARSARALRARAK
jgi:DNA-directed RNA polymerase specialized sigma24 family protein